MVNFASYKRHEFYAIISKMFSGRLYCDQDTFFFHTRTLDSVAVYIPTLSSSHAVRGLLEKYPTFGREKETGLLGALDT